jgi:hypothetical protein
MSLYRLGIGGDWVGGVPVRQVVRSPSWESSSAALGGEVRHAHSHSPSSLTYGTRAWDQTTIR